MTESHVFESLLTHSLVFCRVEATNNTFICVNKSKSCDAGRGGVMLLYNIFFITLHRFFYFTITDVINHILMNRYF